MSSSASGASSSGLRRQQSSSTSQQQSQQQKRIINQPTTLIDLVFGVTVQVARKLLFIKPAYKAVCYIMLIAFLSLLSLHVELSENYFTQKHNIINVYGTKLGWFWTLLILTPFVSLTSFLHHNSVWLTVTHLLRLVVATGFWYACTNSFAGFEKLTSKCMGVTTALHRRECFDKGGKWIPGFDISGHTFILLYSILLISEEAISFRNWPVLPTASSQHVPSDKIAHNEHRRQTRTVQCLFVGLFVMHLIWDFQLVITSLYYHTVSHKILGALFAVVSWLLTYGCWYPYYFPSVPIRWHAKTL